MGIQSCFEEIYSIAKFIEINGVVHGAKDFLDNIEKYNNSEFRRHICDLCKIYNCPELSVFFYCNITLKGYKINPVDFWRYLAGKYKAYDNDNK